MIIKKFIELPYFRKYSDRFFVSERGVAVFPELIFTCNFHIFLKKSRYHLEIFIIFYKIIENFK